MVIDREFEKKLDDLKFWDEEVRDGYLVSAETKKLWAVELDLLRKFIEVCEKYNLNYFVDSGTLLGTIRHKGFIPWDDDIDIVMHRKDYNKLLKVAKEEFGYPYRFQSPYHEKGYYRNHVQIRNVTTTSVLKKDVGRFSFNQGIFLDVFPLDKAPKNVIKRKMHFFNTFLFSVRRRIKYGVFDSKHKTILKISRFISRFIKKESVRFVNYEKMCAKYNYLEDCPIEKYTFREGIEKKMYHMESIWYKNALTRNFEMFEIYVPSGYDNVLKSFYGKNYMTPQKKASTHGDLIISTDRSYDEWVAEKE